MIHALCYFAEKRMLLAFKLAQGLRKSKSLFVQEAVVCTILKMVVEMVQLNHDLPWKVCNPTQTFNGLWSVSFS